MNKNKKQILLATHSTEIIKAAPIDMIMDVNRKRYKYISSPQDLVRIMSGLGSEFSPMLDSVTRTKHILFVENESDARILKSFARIAEIEWPSNLTVWPTASHHEYRNHVIDILRSQVDGVDMISLVDRDKSEYKTTSATLKDSSFSDKIINQSIYAKFRKWRRSEIENYMLSKSVLSRSSGLTDGEIDEFFGRFALILPNSEDFKKTDEQQHTRPFFELSGKEYVNKFCEETKLDKFTIVANFNKNEICEDIITLLNEIHQLCIQ